MTWPLTLQNSAYLLDDVLQEISQDQRHLDVTLKARDTPVSIKANHLVLTTSGSFFEKLLSVIDDSEPIFINMSPDDFGDLEKMIDFLHGGRMEIASRTDLIKIDRLAMFLNVQPVTKALLGLVSSLEAEEVLELLKCFDRGETDTVGEVESFCIKSVGKKMTWLVKNRFGAVLSLDGMHFGRILDQDQLDLPAEIDVWNLARKWVDCNHESKEHFLVLTSVRFGLIPRRHFEEKVKTSITEKDPWLAVQAFYASTGIPRHISEASSTETLLELAKEKVNSIRHPAYILMVMVKVKELETLVAYDVRLGAIVGKHELEAEKRFCTSLVVSPFKDYHLIAVFWTTINRPHFFDVVDIDLETNQENPLPRSGLLDDNTYKSDLATVGDNLVMHCTSNANDQHTVRMYTYVQNSGSWLQLHQLHDTFKSALVRTKKDIYAIGGYDFNLDEGQNRISCYNAATNTFEEKGHLLVCRYDPICCLWDEGIVVAFGRSRDSNEGNFIRLNSIEFFSPTMKTCILLTNFPFPNILADSEFIHVCAHGDCLVFGIQSATFFIDDIFIYNKTHDSWKQFTSIINKTWSFKMVMVPMNSSDLEAISTWVMKRHSLEVKRTSARIQLRKTEKERKQSRKSQIMQGAFALACCSAVAIIAFARKVFLALY